MKVAVVQCPTCGQKRLLDIPEPQTIICNCGAILRVQSSASLEAINLGYTEVTKNVDGSITIHKEKA